MSGIAGLYYLDNRPVELTALNQMVDILAHRGPDGANIWRAGSVGLGHRMLWTTPESLHETLPLSNDAGDLVITADARIDNRDELMTTLGLTPYSAMSVSDSQLILDAYETWGERCPEHLLGDFAFALWDGRKRQLFCARDHLGVRPFYYFQSDQVFVFASEIKGLLCLTEVPGQLNEVRVADYLALLFEDREVTFYQNIFRLPPGYSLTVSNRSTRARTYWSLDPSKELRLRSNEDYAETFREIFFKAVHCRLRSAFPVGSMLSGGLDSSSIVCAALQQQRGARDRLLHTFSAIFPTLPADQLSRIDERRYMSEVQSLDGLEPHFIRGDQLSPLADVDWLYEFEDEPFISPNLFLTLGLYRAAHQAGVRVLLDGFGGDSTVSHGVAYLAELGYTGQWESLMTEITALARQHNISPQIYLQQHGLPHLTELARAGRWVAFATGMQTFHKHFALSRANLLLDYGLKPLVPKSLRQVWQRLTETLQPFSTSESTLIDRNFACRTAFDKRRRRLEQGRSSPPRTAREDHYLALTSGVIPVALTEANQAAAPLFIESRYPFFDKRLLEFCLSLPPDQKLHQGWSRIVMRRALANILPTEVQWRKDKADLSPNFIQGFIRTDRKILDGVILNKPLGIEAYVNVDTLREAYEQLGVRESGDAEFTLWRVVILAMWLRCTGLGV
jgi:asparagine synthase (glutamine-hydrolysing)